MNNRRKIVMVLATMGTMLIACAAHAALSLEGQNGIFLNSLAYPVNANKLELSSHYVDLSDLGGVNTYNVTAGLPDDVELGYTKITSSVTGVKDQNLFLGKWQFKPETKSTPALAAWVIDRHLNGGDGSTDYGLSATKCVKVANRPTVLDLGVRSTKALGLGLFGFGDDRKLKLEGSAAIFLTKNFAVGAEFKQQIGGDTWKDIAFRYVASDSLNIDAGIADLGPGLRRQIALAATYRN
ncbi:MAG TPA: DUF3034 family protein [Armatimonadota bacterium]|jgi:hypothetical protein